MDHFRVLQTFPILIIFFLLQIFRIFDINNDGSVSKKELGRLVKDLFHLFTKKDNPELEDNETLANKAFKVRMNEKC